MLVNMVSVREKDLIKAVALLELRRETSAQLADVTIKHQDFGAYISLRSSFEYTEDLLMLSMFDGYRDESKVVFPKYEEDGESDPFFDDATLDYLYSDGSCISEADSADVPF